MTDALGVNKWTILVYRAMALHRDWGVEKVAEDLGITAHQVRECLDELAEASLIRPSGDSFDGMLLINPSVALAPQLAEQETALEEFRKSIARNRHLVAELTSVWQSAQETQGIGVLLKGLDAVRARLAELCEQAETELLSFIPGGAQSRQSLESSRPLDERHLARGVRMRTVYLTSVRSDRPTREYASWLQRAGGEVRIAPVLPLRMLIVDRSTAVVPLSPDDSREGALVLTARGVIAGLTALFDRVWEDAERLSAEPAHEPGRLTAQERELLRLLAAGHTDEVAARHLGTSVRTARRMVARLMELLNAHSRFEAGYKAAQRQWL
ncbi:LuxR C-terminal-related transcriptional regulator [Streptomyces sp. TRM 70351]|uniref:helix-turn-helix transcriptional regulator n=1 Tax=Streptomyces sp. TRM 70351 TaxID=3116552 RepID=UPI002E7BE4E3|nr:LuxR C-terminal-related transcriptional regulator [Streptomyces sp. TRM 70351]MEE1929024.1 LuxR C-terminal-related transcriptional regulator [Streptomyces sp. TRM 70351]